MAKLLFPYKVHLGDTYLGNLIWNEDEKPSNETINNALNYFLSKGCFVSAYPQGDGICFEHNTMENIDFLRGFYKVFPNLNIDLDDTSENRKLLLEMGKISTPIPGYFYYKLCHKKEHCKEGEELVTFTGPDVQSGIPITVTITKKQYELINKGFPFQVILNNLSENKREFLISGISNIDYLSDEYFSLIDN